jgi:hypothetical protein
MNSKSESFAKTKCPVTNPILTHRGRVIAVKEALELHEVRFKKTRDRFTDRTDIIAPKFLYTMQKVANVAIIIIFLYSSFRSWL